MLQGIRKYSQGWIAGFIISLLILSFALWGIHSWVGEGGGNNTVAKVNGTQVTRQELSHTFERMLRQAEAKANHPLSVSEQLELKNRALKTLIDSLVMQQATLKNDYRVSQGQLQAFIQAMPEFQINGTFSTTVLEATLMSSSLSPQAFVNLIQDAMLSDQPRQGITATSFVLPNELTKAAQLLNEKRNIGYVIIPNNFFVNKPVSISEQDIQRYYDAHKTDFALPEQVSVSYLLLSLDDLAKSIQPTEKDLMNYFSENRNSFVDTTGHQQDYATAKQKVAGAVANHQAELQFAKLREQLANITYEHPDSLQQASTILKLPINQTALFTPNKGADVISNNETVRQAAFSHDVLLSGNNSDVIQVNPNQVIVIRIKQHLPSAMQPLSNVRQSIIAKLTTEMDKQQSMTLSQQIQKQLQQGALPEQIAAKNNLSWLVVSGTGRVNDKVPQPILDKVFDMPIPKGHENFAVAELPDGYAVIGLTGKVIENVAMNSIDQDALNKKMRESMGSMEYGYYQDSIFKRAKIQTEFNENQDL